MCGWARRTSARYGSRRGRTGERLAVWIPLIPILASTDPSPPPPSAGAPSTHADSSLPALVEAHLRAHLESQGVYIDLSLPEVPPLQPLPAGNVPLPGDPASWAESLSTAVQCCSHHLDIFPPGRVALVIATFETRTTELDTDEMILVLALLAVGRQIELALLRDRACDDANVFFLLAMRTLDEWAQCSLLALGERCGSPSTCGLCSHSRTGALHLLHFFALRHGSKTDFEQVLDRLTEHCLQLGLHHKSTVSLYPTDDSPGRLFYLTMYKDTRVMSLLLGTLGLTPGGTRRLWAVRRASL